MRCNKLSGEHFRRRYQTKPPRGRLSQRRGPLSKLLWVDFLVLLQKNDKNPQTQVFVVALLLVHKTERSLARFSQTVITSETATARWHCLFISDRRQSTSRCCCCCCCIQVYQISEHIGHHHAGQTALYPPCPTLVFGRRSVVTSAVSRRLSAAPATLIQRRPISNADTAQSPGHWRRLISWLLITWARLTLIDYHAK